MGWGRKKKAVVVKVPVAETRPAPVEVLRAGTARGPEDVKVNVMNTTKQAGDFKRRTVMRGVGISWGIGLWLLLAAVGWGQPSMMPPATTPYTRDFLRASNQSNAWYYLGITEAGQTTATNWITEIPAGTVDDSDMFSAGVWGQINNSTNGLADTNDLALVAAQAVQTNETREVTLNLVEIPGLSAQVRWSNDDEENQWRLFQDGSYKLVLTNITGNKFVFNLDGTIEGLGSTLTGLNLRASGGIDTNSGLFYVAAPWALATPGGVGFSFFPGHMQTSALLVSGNQTNIGELRNFNNQLWADTDGLAGASIAVGTVNSNAFDTATAAALGVGGVGEAFATTNVTTTYTVGTGRQVIVADTTGGSFSITLPSGAREGWYCSVKLVGINALTVLPGSGRAIDGASSLLIETRYSARNLVLNGTNWWVY